MPFFKRYPPKGKSDGQYLAALTETFGEPPTLIQYADGRTLAKWRDHHSLIFTGDGLCHWEYWRSVNELDLSWAFRQLGNLSGLTLQTIVMFAGPPNARSAGHNYLLAQWHRQQRAAIYSIAIKFDPANGLFLGIANQYATNPR